MHEPACTHQHPDLCFHIWKQTKTKSRRGSIENITSIWAKTIREQIMGNVCVQRERKKAGMLLQGGPQTITTHMFNKIF